MNSCRLFASPAVTLLVLVNFAFAGSAPAQPLLETPSMRLGISSETGSCEIVDKRAGVTWRSNPFQPRFGEVTLRVDGRSERVVLGRCDLQRKGDAIEATFRPRAEQPSAALRVVVRAVGDGDTLDCRYAADPALNVESIRLFDDVFWATDTEEGYGVVPVREGLLVPADSGLSFVHRFDTYAYEGCHMAMLGLVKSRAALLLTWSDAYVAADLKSSLTNAAALSARQVLSASLTLRQSATAFQIRVLGRGDYNTVAQAYREVAQREGWLVKWNEKLKGHAERGKLFGASNFKLWSALDRQMNEESTREERVRVNWTFGEAAQVAEHLKNDLKLDKVLFLMGGWIHRGYDNQHPDILPAAPECGGDAALADCAQRVRALGYLFGLHDNYQDMYRDAPSWNEDFIMKTADGQLSKGGKWAGGRAYVTCSQKALELAKRPQNLPAVKQLTGADVYFIDTTYAAGLQECFDPKHPLRRQDDMKWKQALSDYARDLFGVFGSECGREWAIPHSDFFEGLTGVSGRHYHDEGLEKKLGASVVPLFELVYRDAIAMYGKYGYDPAHAAEYVLHHISIGRPLHYHNIPAHLYWKQPSHQSQPAVVSGPAVFTRGDNGWTEGLHPLDRFLKNTHEILSPLHELTAQVPMSQHQFLTPDRRVQRSVFGAGADAIEVVVNARGGEYRQASKQGGEVVLPSYGFLIEGSEFIAFHALSWAGHRYEAPVLFTLRSLDGQPLNKSRQIRVFHAFGEDQLSWRGKMETVSKERILLE